MGSMFIGLFFSTASAQKDVEATMTLPTAGTTIEVGVPFDVEFTVTNVGADDLVVEDSVWFAVTVAGGNIFGSNIFLAARTNDVVSQGESWTFTAPGLQFSTIQSTSTEDMCVVLFLYEGTATTPTVEPDMNNNQSCMAMDFVQGSVSLEDGLVLDNSKITAYPNPAHEVVNFEVSGDIERIAITNLAGQTVMEIDVDESMEIVNVSELGTGIYMYTAYKGNGDTLAPEKLVIR